jgi:hypothetical protein
MGDDQSANNIAITIKQAINDRYDHLLLSERQTAGSCRHVPAAFATIVFTGRHLAFTIESDLNLILCME